MHFLLTMILTLGCLSTYAQSESDSENLKDKSFTIINSSYPEKKMTAECHDETCETVTFYYGSKGRLQFLNRIYLRDHLRDSQKEVGRRYIDLDCKNSNIPGAPCFSLTRNIPKNVRKAFKEGRNVKAVSEILISPVVVVIDVLFTFMPIAPMVQLIESTHVTPAEITRKERRVARRKLRRGNYVLEKMKEDSNNRVLRVKDRIYEKLIRKIKSI